MSTTELIVESALKPARGKKFQPTEFHKKFVENLLNSNPGNLAELSQATGLSFSQIAGLLEDAAACRWITEQCAGIAKLGLGAVYQHIMQKALTSEKPGWAELFLKRFDENYQPKGSAVGGTQNTQINLYGNYSDQELLATVRSLRQQVLGEHDGQNGS